MGIYWVQLEAGFVAESKEDAIKKAEKMLDCDYSDCSYFVIHRVDEDEEGLLLKERRERVSLEFDRNLEEAKKLREAKGE